MSVTWKQQNRLGETDFYEFVGKRLKQVRLNHGLSQIDLAEEMEVSFQQIQKYEQGYNRIPLFKLLLAAEVFNVPLSLFLPEDSNVCGNP